MSKINYRRIYRLLYFHTVKKNVYIYHIVQIIYPHFILIDLIILKSKLSSSVNCQVCVWKSGMKDRGWGLKTWKRNAPNRLLSKTHIPSPYPPSYLKHKGKGKLKQAFPFFRRHLAPLLMPFRHLKTSGSQRKTGKWYPFQVRISFHG